MFIKNNGTMKLNETIDGWTATVLTEQKGEPTKFDTFEINESAVKLLKFLGMQNDTQKIVTEFCKKHEIDVDENKTWIVNFLQGLVAYGAAAFGENYEKFAVEITHQEGRKTPTNVTIEITNTCNEECDHCYLTAGPHKHDQISFDRFVTLCDELYEANTLMVELTGGEVFMHPQFTKMLKVALSRFAKVAILSNGTILPESALKILSEHRDKIVVSISLDSIDPVKHNTFRHHRGAHEKTIRNIRRMTKEGVQVRITSVIWEENKWEIDKLCDLARDLGAFAFSFNFIEEFGRGIEISESNKIASDKEYANYLADIIKNNEDMIPTLTRNDVETPLNCGAAKNSITISPNGYLRPCNLFPQDFFAGSILDNGSWKTEIDSTIIKKLGDIPSPSVEHGCDPRCWNLQHCAGCYLKGLDSNKKRPKSQRCTWVRKNDLDWAVERLGQCNQ